MRSKLKNRRTFIEYDEAPSGEVALYNYKEPLMPFTDGFGFVGVLLFDATSNKIQCHYCGDWFDSLPAHIHREHAMRASEYKNQVGLAQSTALINEKVRKQLIKSSKKNSNYLSKLGVARFKKGHNRSGQKLPMEIRNLRGTCPLQLLDKLDRIKADLGHTPTYMEVKRTTILNNKKFSGKGLVRSIEHVFGNWDNAVAQLSWTGVDRKKNRKWNRESLLEALRQFVVLNNRYPTRSDTRRRMFPAPLLFKNHCGSFKQAKDLIIISK